MERTGRAREFRRRGRSVGRAGVGIACPAGWVQECGARSAACHASGRRDTAFTCSAARRPRGKRFSRGKRDSDRAVSTRGRSTTVTTQYTVHCTDTNVSGRSASTTHTLATRDLLLLPSPPFLLHCVTRFIEIIIANEIRDANIVSTEHSLFLLHTTQWQIRLAAKICIYIIKQNSLHL